MRLVLKLAVAFLLVVCAVIAVHDLVRYRQEVADFEADLDRTQAMVAKALAAAAQQAFQQRGAAAARELISELADFDDEGLKVRWICASPALPDAFEREACDTLAEAHGPLQIEMPGTPPLHVTLMPIRAAQSLVGALEVSEPDTREKTWAERTIRNTVALSVVLVVTCSLLAFGLGIWLVARPTRELIDKARAVGRGVFDGPLITHRRDEFGLLALEMNAMCERLERARAQTADEAAAKTAALEQLRHADRLATVGTLASGVAHELGTPLHVIEMRAGFIVDDGGASRAARESAQVIVSCTERIARIVRQLVVFARENRLERSYWDAAALARSIVELLRPTAALRGVELSFRGNGADPLRVFADGVLLQQALTNLVMNAIQATQEGGSVVIRTEKEELSRGEAGKSWARFDVADTGEGIPQSSLHRVFEPFFTTKAPGEGTGLGLAVTYGIIQEHGGFIEVRSQPGQGSVFSVHVPAEDRS